MVDASVVAKWLLPEEGDAAALSLQQRYYRVELELLAPRLLIAEVGSALSKRVRRGQLSREAAAVCFDRLLVYAPILVESAAVDTAAFHLALAHRAAVYDCLYLALALEQQCDLITADERFARSLGPAFPGIRLLREF